MTKRVFRIREGEPLLDMPNAAYPGACRTRQYAELGTDVSS